MVFHYILILIRLHDENPKDTLSFEALPENITMVNNNQQCWLSCIKGMLNECGVSHFYNNSKSLKNSFILLRLRKYLQCKVEKIVV